MQPLRLAAIALLGRGWLRAVWGQPGAPVKWGDHPAPQPAPGELPQALERRRRRRMLWLLAGVEVAGAAVVL